MIRNKVLLNFYEAFNMINDENLVGYRKVMKILRTGVNEHVKTELSNIGEIHIGKL